jgi:hypothetical protein
MQETSRLDAIRRAIAEHLAYQSEWRGQKAGRPPGSVHQTCRLDVTSLPNASWNERNT